MRSTVVAKLFSDFVEVVADDLEHSVRLGKDVFELGDGFE